MTTMGRYAGAVMELVRKGRRANAGRAPIVFANTYLANHFCLPMAAMHENTFEELKVITDQRGTRMAIAAPRGHAKSTVVTLGYALWCLLYQKEQFVLIVSNTADQAAKLLGHIKEEIENNTLLQEDFPELLTATKVSPWRKNSILLPNGTVVMSYGTGQNLRGARYRQHRPSLIIADDLEDKDLVIQEEQRQKTAEWFRSTVLKAGNSNTNVVVVGTVLHHDSLLAHLIDPIRTPGWLQKKYAAIRKFSDRQDLWEQWAAIYRGETPFQTQTGPAAAQAFLEANRTELMKGTSVLWRHNYPYDKLMETRIREGEGSFQAEMQNEPLDPAVCIFANAKFQFWDSEYSDPEKLIKALGPGSFYGACDPSLGSDPRRGDFSAIVVLFKPDKNEILYVIAADIARRTPHDTITRILQYAQMYPFSEFGVEGVQFQELMVEDLERRAEQEGNFMSVQSIKSRSNKQARIGGLEAEVSQGRIRFNRGHQALMDQLRAFPVGLHDDGPDALEMAVATARNQNFTVIEQWS